MPLKNSATGFGSVTIVLHWVMAVGIVGLFASGLWIERLDYYSELYQIVPHWHKSVGVVIVVLMLARLVWRVSHIYPAAIPTHKPYEKTLSKIIQWTFYAAVLSMFASGYFITTAKGQPLIIFGDVSIPALISSSANIEDIAGSMHKYSGFAIIGLAALHALAALKHHFIDKDTTLRRMFGHHLKHF